jgi:hypothetical protein
MLGGTIAMIILILAGTGAIAVLMAIFLVVVIAGIRTCEKHMSITDLPITRAEKLASRVLGTQAAIGDEEVLTK